MHRTTLRTPAALAALFLLVAAPWVTAADAPSGACDPRLSLNAATDPAASFLVEEPRVTPLPRRQPAPRPQAKSCAAIEPTLVQDCGQCHTYCTQIPVCQEYCVGGPRGSYYCECVYADP